MDEQARLSGIQLDPTHADWRDEGWPPMLGGRRCWHASVAIGTDRDNDQQTVVVVGGELKVKVTDSVIVMNLDDKTKQWRHGPRMKEKRACLGAKVTNGWLYAIGGYSCNGTNYLDTVERIDVNKLLQKEYPAETQWKRLNCRLSYARAGMATAIVKNRYIVVAGGHNNGLHALKCVEILDTGIMDAEPTIVSISDLSTARCYAATEVIDSRMFVVGGRMTMNSSSTLNSVESIEFTDTINNNGALMSIQDSTRSTKHSLKLSSERENHTIAKIGNCLVVAGGCNRKKRTLLSVEVLDTNRQVVWSLPNLTRARYGSSMVALSNRMLMIGGKHCASTESLGLVESTQGDQNVKVMTNKRPAPIFEENDVIITKKLAVSAPSAAAAVNVTVTCGTTDVGGSDDSDKKCRPAMSSNKASWQDLAPWTEEAFHLAASGRSHSAAYEINKLDTPQLKSCPTPIPHTATQRELDEKDGTSDTEQLLCCLDQSASQTNRNEGKLEGIIRAYVPVLEQQNVLANESPYSTISTLVVPPGPTTAQKCNQNNKLCTNEDLYKNEVSTIPAPPTIPAPQCVHELEECLLPMKKSHDGIHAEQDLLKVRVAWSEERLLAQQQLLNVHSCSRTHEGVEEEAEDQSVIVRRLERLEATVLVVVLSYTVLLLWSKWMDLVH